MCRRYQAADPQTGRPVSRASFGTRFGQPRKRSNQCSCRSCSTSSLAVQCGVSIISSRARTSVSSIGKRAHRGAARRARSSERASYRRGGAPAWLVALVWWPRLASQQDAGRGGLLLSALRCEAGWVPRRPGFVGSYILSRGQKSRRRDEEIDRSARAQSLELCGRNIIE